MKSFVRTTALILALATVASSPQADSSSPLVFGAVFKTGELLCYEVPKTARIKYPEIAVITPDTQRLIATATIGKADARCNPGQDMTGYRLTKKTGYISKNENYIEIGVITANARIEEKDDMAIVTPEGTDQPVAFHSCTSSDGVHLTAWKGKALTGTRIWHAYRNLNTDLDANCSDAETAE